MQFLPILTLLGVGDSFAEARQCVKEKVASTDAEGDVMFFLVPRHVTRLRIPTLRLQSLKQSERPLIFKPVTEGGGPEDVSQ